MGLRPPGYARETLEWERRQMALWEQHPFHTAREKYFQFLLEHSRAGADQPVT